MNSRQRRAALRKIKGTIKNFIFSSCGNDSVALMKWAIDNGVTDEKTAVVYSNTGWAHPDWKNRVREVGAYAKKHGIKFVVLKSEGMEALVRRKKGWPMPASAMQFCTDFLKIKPAQQWMDRIDPKGESICYVGLRKEESTNRKDTPECIESSEKHGGRKLYFPIRDHVERERDVLINSTGIEVLNHSSDECFPCVCSNKMDLRRLQNETPELIDKIEKIETEMGFTRNNKPRVMFRPYRHMGAIGIREVSKWSQSKHGKYEKPIMECSSGFCKM